MHRRDTSPSFLNHALDGSSATSERSPKKARLSDPDSNNTIASNLSSGSYTSLQALRSDAEHVAANLTSVIRSRAKERDDKSGSLLVDDLKQIQRAQAFEQFVKNVVEQETRYDAMHEERDPQPKKENGNTPNGHPPSKNTAAGAAARYGSVLTLFGNAPTPKQLFSSMQTAPPGKADTSIKIELPVEEMSLPAGISATQIMSVPAISGKKGPTFEEAFPPPYSLPALNPPKAHRRSAARDEVVKWEFQNPPSARNKKGGYTVQSLAVGEWLDYGGPDSKDEVTSPREKRKQRDRALSSGQGSAPPPSKAAQEDALAKEEEALFWKAYSSFAPSCDNSKALVPEEVKSMVWWHKIGQKKYQETFALDPALADGLVIAPPQPLPEEQDDDFAAVVEQYDGFDDELPEADSARDKADVDQVLDHISELLETLASHQRIRNASLQPSSSATRTPVSPAPSLALRIGRPDSPSDEEISTYLALRRELAYLILKLPPYAVAKMNGDQLDELGVRQLVTLEGKNVQGTLEEDQVARLAKYTAAATAHGIAALTRPGSANQHYSSTNQRTPAIGQAANTRYGQSVQYSRTPMSQPQYNRSLSNQQSYGTPTASAPKPAYSQSNTYTAQQSGYNQPNGGKMYYGGRQLAQTPSMYGKYGAQYPSATTPGIPQHQQQQQPRPSYPTSTSSQPLAQFQQRSYSAAHNAVAYQSNSQGQQGSPYNRTASPLKPANYQPPLQPSPVPRAQQQFQPPPLGGQQAGLERVATPGSYGGQSQTPVNGIGQPPPTPQQQQQGNAVNGQV